MHETGYLTKENGRWKHFHYFIKDHLGNNRLVVNQSGAIVQSLQYEPFGMTFADGINAGWQPYKFGGKEEETDCRLNWYDFESRLYVPDLGRFMQPDPLAEKYYSISPYAYCGNNPINAVDPDGMDYYYMSDQGQIVLALKTDDKFDRIYAFNTDKEGNTKATTIDIKGQELLPQLTGSLKDGGHTAITSNSTDAFNLFKFGADNSNIEWSLSGFKDNNQTKFYLNTQHSESYAKLGYGEGGAFNEKDMLFNVHSHSKSDGSKGGSGYVYDLNSKTGECYLKGYDPNSGSDGIPSSHLYKTTGKVMPMYVYHRSSQGLYRYTPWNNADRKWLNVPSGARMKSIVYPQR